MCSDLSPLISGFSPYLYAFVRRVNQALRNRRGLD